MSDKVTHTPGPWRVSAGCREHIESPTGQMVADCCKPPTGAEGRANAELIVRAVNAHADLLAACIAMRATMYSPKSEESRLADAAIAKATGN